MKHIGSTTILHLLVIVLLASCTGTAPTPVTTPTQTMETATSAAIIFTETSTAIAINTVFPTDTSTATPKPTLLPALDTPIPIPGGIVYYYFADLHQVPPHGSVVVMPESLILAPAQLNTVYGADVAADLRSALETVLKDERNVWFGDKLRITQASYNDGHVNLVLEGEYYAVAPVVLTAARAQILMTLFSNPAVHSATATINGENISNIAISNSMDAKPLDYAYTREEIETFMAENAYFKP